MQNQSEKFFPNPGDKLNLVNPFTDTSVPCTVVGNKSAATIVVRECRLTFPLPRYFDTLPIAIEPGTPGVEDVHELHWAPKAGCWKEVGRYGRRAHFEEWDYRPHLD